MKETMQRPSQIRGNSRAIPEQFQSNSRAIPERFHTNPQRHARNHLATKQTNCSGNSNVQLNLQCQQLPSRGNHPHHRHEPNCITFSPPLWANHHHLLPSFHSSRRAAQQNTAPTCFHRTLLRHWFPAQPHWPFIKPPTTPSHLHQISYEIPQREREKLS